MKTARQDLSERKAAHNNPAYSKLSFLMGCGVQVRGEGSYVEDATGRKYLAMFDQYGNQSFGYSHPRVLAAIREQLDSMNVNSSKVMVEPEQVVLAERLAAVGGGHLPYAYFANGGGESIDNALKLARAYDGRPGIVTAEGCFHGKTFGALSASGRPEHRALFSPLLDHFGQVPYGDIDALRRVVDERTAAVLLEPVQAEGGVHVPPPDYLPAVRELCDERGALLIFDEMQTAFGRCGTFFAHQHFGVFPDLACIGKAFGGGVVPISAVLGTEAVWGPLVDAPSTFGSSLGGNPVSCRVGLESVAIASEPAFLTAVADKGRRVGERLAALAARHPDVVEAHRGIGMMHGLALRGDSLGGLVLKLLIDRGVSSTFCLYDTSVLRVQPPLTISDADLDTGLDAVDEVFRSLAGPGTGAARPAVAELTGSRSVAVRRTLPAPPDEVLAALTAHPHALDPFAADPAAGGPGIDHEFAGTLGDDVIVWPDRSSMGDDAVTSAAEACWLWRRLDRSARVRAVAGEPGLAEVEALVTWDAGTGVYEDFVGGPIEYFVRRRLAELADDLETTMAGAAGRTLAEGQVR